MAASSCVLPAGSASSSARSRARSARSVSACELHRHVLAGGHRQGARDQPGDPGDQNAPRRRAAATPRTRLAVDTMPSLAPSTAARSQPIRSVRCRSRVPASADLSGWKASSRWCAPGGPWFDHSLALSGMRLSLLPACRLVPGSALRSRSFDDVRPPARGSASFRPRPCARCARQMLPRLRRRRFFTAAGGDVTLGAPVEGARTRRTPVRVGLIGAGKFGSMFLSQVRPSRGREVAAIADLDPDRARACRRGRLGRGAASCSRTRFDRRGRAPAAETSTS